MESSFNSNTIDASISNERLFNGIDLFKFFCAYLVMMVHIAPFQTGYGFEPVFNFFTVLFARTAVPFFFTASGFLLFRKMQFRNPDMSRVKKYVFRILRLWAIWIIILFFGPHVQLWYFRELAIATIILSLLLKSKIKTKALYLIILFLFLIGLSGDAYFSFIEPLKHFTTINSFFTFYAKYFGTTRNGLFFGVPFMFIGALFAHKKIKMNMRFAIFGFIASVILLMVEGGLLKTFTKLKDTNLLISLAFTTFFAFYIAININLKNSCFYRKLRAIGVLVFCLHMMIYNLVMPSIEMIAKNTGIDFCPLLYPICAFIATSLAVLIEWLSRKDSFAYLKYLFS